MTNRTGLGDSGQAVNPPSVDSSQTAHFGEPWCYDVGDLLRV
jgi:hypothetical protein